MKPFENCQLAGRYLRETTQLYGVDRRFLKAVGSKNVS